MMFRSSTGLLLVAILLLTGGSPQVVASPLPEENGFTQFPYFNSRVGSSGMNMEYKFTPEPGVVEMGRRVVELGGDAYKFQLGGDNYRTLYTDLPELPADQRNTTLEVLLNEPAYQAVFDLPLKFFVMYAFGMEMPYYDVIRTGYGNTEWAQKEYDQLYELTRHLLQTYQGTGKVFIITSWESDWPLLEGQGEQGTPTGNRIQGFIEWFNNRYKAINDARNSLPDVTGVEVFHSEEINIIQKVLDDPSKKAIVNAVLPHVTVDLVAYSAYNAINHVEQLSQRLHTHLDYIESQAKLSGRWHYGRPVIIGEYNYGHLPNGPVRGERSLLALRSAGSWGCPLILYWMTYSGVFTTAWDTGAWIDPDGTRTNEYHQQQEYAGKLHILKNATRVWLNRNPTEAEVNALSANFHEKSNAEIMREVVNSADFQAALSHRDYLELLFRVCLVTLNFSQTLFTTTLAELESGAITRWDACLRVIDSSQFAEKVNSADYLQYLAEWQHHFPRPETLIGTRSANFIAAVDGKAFMMRELALRKLDVVDDEIYRRYLPYVDPSIRVGAAPIPQDGIHDLDTTTQAMGLRYFGAAFMDRGVGTVSRLAGAVNDETLMLRDRAAWNSATGLAHAFDNELRFLFRGSGVDVHYLVWDQTDRFHYDLDNGFAQGSMNTWGTPAIKTLRVAAPGSLSPWSRRRWKPGRR